MNIFKKTLSIVAVASMFTACKKDEAIIVIPPSDGAQLQLNGLIANEAGSSAGNSVYVDLSGNKQAPVARGSWDMGFYSGSDFRVIINNTTTATAKALTKNDLTQVTTGDTVGFSASMAVGYDATGYALLDNVQGDLSKTVIAAISATDTDNKVYIINRGTGGGITRDAASAWIKIRILRKGTGYTLQYAKIAETTFKTLDVNKDAAYNFNYVSFDNGAVKVEPLKTEWDFVWGYTMFETALGASNIPYPSSDFISINFRNGVQVAEVLTATGGAYADFTGAKIASVTFTSTVDALGTKWRTAAAPPAKSGVKTDRFYVVKDVAGNYYKVKFLSFHGDDGGTRGKPEFEFKLVKKA